MDLYHGNLRAVDAQGKTIFDQVDYQKYVDLIAEDVRDWSYMKFPSLRSWGGIGLVPGGTARPPEHCGFHRPPRPAESARQGVSRGHRR